MLDVLKVVIWPLVATVLAIFAMVIFRKQFAQLIGRLHAIKAPGFEFNVEPAQQAEESKVLDKLLGEPIIEAAPAIHTEATVKEDLEQAKRRELVKNIDVSPIVLEQEEIIRKDIDGLKIPQPELPDILIRHLAVTQLALRAEMFYRMIFGSQIELLKAANEFGARTTDEAKAFYDAAIAKYPGLAPYPFADYMNFLITHGLLVQEDDKFAITTAGREFLKYLIEIKASSKKPF